MGPWFDRSNYTKAYIIIIIFLCVLVVGLLLAVSVLSRKPEDISMCETSDCMKAAVNLQQSLDLSADLCDDIYSFACGEFINAHPIPEHRSVWGQNELTSKILTESLKARIKETLLNADYDRNEYPEIVEKSKIFYNACTNMPLRDNNGYKGLKRIFKQIPWPMLDVFWGSYNYRWENTFAFINKVFGFNFLLTNFVWHDIENSSSHAIYVGPPSFGFGIPREMLRNSKSEYSSLVIRAYKKFISESVKLLSNSDGDVNKFLTNKIDELVEFEIRLANITTNFDQTKTTIKEFMLDYKGIPLLAIEKSVFEGIVDDITGDEEVIVNDKNYLRNFKTVIDDTDNEVIANYLGWRLVKELGKYTTNEFRKIELQYKHLVMGMQNETPLWEQCVKETNKRLPLAVGRLYVDRKFSTHAETNCWHNSQQIILAVKRFLISNTWMSYSTTKNVLNKINSVHFDIGYPEFIKNNKLLEHYHKELGNINENYFDSAVNLLKWENAVKLKKLNTSITDVLESCVSILTSWRQYSL